jgi:hypothetical protein
MLLMCHRCPHRRPPRKGVSVCKLDGADIIAHSRDMHCPAGRYQLGLGDTIAGVLHKTGIGPAYKKLRSKITTKPCGCPKRQATLNVLAPNRNNATAP